MKMRRRLGVLSLVFSIIFILPIFLQSCGHYSDTGEGEDTQPSAPAPSDDLLSEEERGVLELDGRRYTYTGDPSDISVREDVLTLKRAGVYRIRGRLTDGRIVASDASLGRVTLLLDGVTLSSSCGSPISSEQGTNLVIEAVKGSVNLLARTATSRAAGSFPDGCISACSSLILTGEGSLVINSKSEAAIVCRQSFELRDADLTLSSADVGVWARDRITVLGGALKISHSKTGLLSDGDEISTGKIEIRSGTVSVISSEVALCAGRDICVSGGVGSFDCPSVYRCQKELGGKIQQGKISILADNFPKK